MEKKKLEAALIFLAVVSVVTGWYLLQQKETAAPDFSLVDLEGSTFSLSDFRGKVVVIDFMATWCGPCTRQISNYKVVWEKFRNRIILMSIGIDPTESEDTLRAFAKLFPYAKWIWAKDTANLAEAYGVTAIPKTVIIDQKGNIRYSHVGVTSASTIIEEIEYLIK